LPVAVLKEPFLTGSRKKQERQPRGDDRMPAVIDKDTCTGCENCVEVCPVDAITMNDGKAEVDDSCIDCGQCVDECPVDAIEMQ